jgi:hypothetical protein
VTPIATIVTATPGCELDVDGGEREMFIVIRDEDGEHRAELWADNARALVQGINMWLGTQRI